MIESLLVFMGRLHPVVLHLPIGVLAALAACEAACLIRGQPLDRGVRLVLVVLAALSGLATAGAGWLLAGEGGYGGSALTLHRWLGVGLAAGVLLTAFAAVAGKGRAYGVLLVVSLVVMAPAGHFGGTITHGAGFLTEPFRGGTGRDRAGPAVVDTSVERFPQDVYAVFNNRCFSCHGENRQKGGLAMHTPAALFAGADYGPVVVPYEPDESELLIRMRLPADDEYHMPPDSHPQPSEAEIEAIARWIADGAPVLDGVVP